MAAVHSMTLSKAQPITVIWSPGRVVMVELASGRRLPCSIETVDMQALRAFASGVALQCHAQLVLRIQDLADNGLIGAHGQPLIEAHNTIAGLFTTAGTPLLTFRPGARLLVRSTHVVHNCAGFSRRGANLVGVTMYGAAPWPALQAAQKPYLTQTRQAAVNPSGPPRR